MSRYVVSSLIALLSAAPLLAQNGREHFVQADTTLDAAHKVQSDAFVVLRDSTSAIRAAGSRLMSDLTSSSSLQWMQARAGAIATACERSVAPLADARSVTKGASLSREVQKEKQADLLKEMESFAKVLTDCQVRWTGLSRDTSQTALREKSPYEMKKLEEKLDKLNRAAQTYLRYISVKLPPPGTPKS